MEKLDNKDELLEDIYLANNLIGESEYFKATLQTVKKIAKYDVGIYIFGETGTGKELIARAVHYLSKRRNGPFIPVNCGAFTEDLIINELFGHVRGAYTGALEKKSGLVEEAEGGTLFLDEVDSLTPKAQVTLLRFLQDKEFKSLGGSKMKKVNTRVIAASNKDLKLCVASGHFREDLLYRLDILRIDLPPLRERKGDISLLTDHFMRKISCDLGLEYRYPNPECLAYLEQYHWPGNIRELENCIYKLCLLSEQSILESMKMKDDEYVSNFKPVFIAGDQNRLAGFSEEKEKTVTLFEKRYLEKVLSLANGNISRAAKQAKKERRTFSRLLRKHGIDRKKFAYQPPATAESLSQFK